MSRKLNHTIDTSVLDHLSGSKSIKLDGYSDVKGVRKDRKDKFLSQGFVVIKKSKDSDIILMGKKLVKESEVIEMAKKPAKKEVKKVAKKK